MKKLAKILCMALCLTLLLTLILGNKQVGTAGSGCHEIKLYEHGDFIITEHNTLYGFSSKVAQKNHIIFPKKINGFYLKIHNQQPGMFGGIFLFGHLDYYENLKRFYQFDALTSKFEGFSLDYFKTEEVPIAHLDKTLIYPKQNHKFFANNCARYTKYGLGRCYINNYATTFLSEQEVVFAYLTKERYNADEYAFKTEYMLANIEFLYNYEGCPNFGYYWIDDLETGETLTYIPPNPTREGYSFGGWYADSECVIPYDFTVPYLKKDYIFKEGIVNDKESFVLVYPQDYITYIYAKWVQN